MHIIRLRGPWELEPLERYVAGAGRRCETRREELPAACTQKMPADWAAVLGRDFFGLVRYTRNFNRPTNLEPHERVWLVVEPPRSHGRVFLDGELLGEARYGTPAARFDITPLLKDHNSVEVLVAHPSFADGGHSIEPADLPGGLVGEVRLEIGPE